MSKGLSARSHIAYRGVQDLPIYLRIRSDIKSRISGGEFAPGTAIPSESDLARHYGTTKLTVRNAIDGLVEEGIVARLQGKGTFVSQGLADENPSSHQPRGFRDSQGGLRRAPSVRVLENSVRAAGPFYARLFDVPAESDLYYVRRLNCIDGEPFAIESTLIPCDLFPGIVDVDISIFSLYEYYALNGHEVVRATEELEVRELKPREAQLLRGTVDDPALGLSCISYDADGRALEFVRSVAIGEHACFRVRQ